MPLVRFEVRNEFGLGDPQLYRAPQKRDDPKAILDGVAVAGLVGILRQLGDLAELASDIFQDLLEQVTITSARGRGLLNRIRHLETELPSYENAIRGQRSHIHFAYVAGSDWHSDAKTEESHVLASDLPRFMLDSYEECQDPPRLYLLDKFDNAGPGACLKRYSDPSYFKRVWATTGLEKAENIQGQKKAQKTKKKRSNIQLGEVQHDLSSSRHYSSTQFASPDGDDQQYSTEDAPLPDMNLKPELASRSLSLASGTMLSTTEQLPEISPPVVLNEQEFARFSGSDLQIDESGSFASDVHDKVNEVTDTYNGFPHGSLKEENAYKLPYVTWDEKTEIPKPASPGSSDDIVMDDTQHLEPPAVSSLQSNVEPKTAVVENLERENIIFSTANIPAPLPTANYFEDIASETDNYMDALNTLESEAETDSECQTKREVKSFPNFSYSQMEPETSHMHEVASPSSVFSGAETASRFSSATNEDEPPITTPPKTLEPVQPPEATNSLPDPDNCIGNHLYENNALDVSKDSSFKVSTDNQSPELDNCTSPTILELRTSDSEYSIHNQSSEPNALDTSRCSFEVTKGDQSVDLGICTSSTILEPRAAEMSKSSGSSPLTISSFPSTKLWTNGGLLGLAPSKPPDFGAVNARSKDFASDSRETEGLPNASLDQSSPSADQQFRRNDNMVPQVNQSSPPCPDNQDEHMLVHQYSKRQLSVPSSSHPEKIQMVMPTNANAQNGFDLTVPRGSEFPCNNVDPQPNGSGQSTMAMASSFSSLAQRILANSLHRGSSIAYAQSVAGSTDSSQQNGTHLNNQNEGQRGVNPEEHYPENISNIRQMSSKNSISSHSWLSGHSSPPLEHMNISFHPMNGLDGSKLKLEYAGANFHESIQDLIFPSFQLLPQPNLPSEDNVSETDDDTFCRSCPCTSEDHLSPRSDSNSELWEDNMSGENHHDIYNDLHGISLSSSVSSFQGFDHMNQIDLANGFEDTVDENNVLYFRDTNSAGLPALDSFISTSGRLCDPLSAEGYSSQSQNELPPPPPLPPVEWRATKASVYKEEKDPSVAEIVEHFNVLQAQRCTAPKQQEQNTPRPFPLPEKVACSDNNVHNQQKPKRQIDVSHAPKDNELDMKEELLHQFKNLHHGQKLNGCKEARNNDTESEQLEGSAGLLHQIRNKSFNLRHASTTKLSAAPQSTTNTNVAAILEKANAIRQAFVGSDDGVDGDNWSDG